MVKLVSDGRGRMQYLEKRLRDINYHLPSNQTDKDYRAYQQRIMASLISRGENAEAINNFFAETDRLYSAALPSENELEWYRNDARASLWLACELYELMKKNGFEHEVIFLSPGELQPRHNVRVDAIRSCIDNWPLSLTNQTEYIKKKSIEWAELIDRHNIFSDVNAKSVDVCSWLKTHIQEKTSISLNRVCGESSEEVMAWCYASYFMWRKNNLQSPDSVELFVRKFKSAWSTQKNRIKNRVERKLLPVSVNISQKAHDKMRDLSISEGMSNDKVIESAIELMFRNKKR
ncbi:hypothetical protein J4L45_004603 [Salmonella enterica subsp. enterica serovar Newport]|nr:hypothetical protein [Salmonella enterica subsp. enterica serovar Newport]EHB3482371.1 hypothetical protein [Salmonella enterica subsp. enterica serovar Newport]EHG5859534.1 hypothetical protein [Salmonella enterica subsp. enterica serovar Newport]